MDTLKAALKKNPSEETPCKTEAAKFEDPKLGFFDTPDLGQCEKTDEVVLKEIESIIQADSGADQYVVLYVYKWESRITTFDISQAKLVKKFFGEGCNFVPLITCRNEEVLKYKYEKLKDFIMTHFGVEAKEFCLTENGDKDTEGKNLLKKIREVTRDKKPFTKEMFEKMHDLHKAQTGDKNQTVTNVTNSVLEQITGIPKQILDCFGFARVDLAKSFAEATMNAHK